MQASPDRSFLPSFNNVAQANTNLSLSRIKTMISVKEQSLKSTAFKTFTTSHKSSLAINEKARETQALPLNYAK